jgi:hypothetical protein
MEALGLETTFSFHHVEEAALNIMDGVQDDQDMEAGKGQNHSYADVVCVNQG